jgi:phosphatidylserine/phosphatidylglycerophosphate/cardiolipin synthase-like enzyme
VASPKGWLPDEASWDLPRIVALLDAATQSIQVQVLKYKTQDRSGNRFTELDDALRRAGARGVKVRMLVSEWALKDISLQDLAPVAEIRVIKVPAWSGGTIPFARVAHAKYLVVDDHAAWIGTSNWEGDYFTKSRNIGVILHDGAVPARLAKFFEENWTSTYTIPLPKIATSPMTTP